MTVDLRSFAERLAYDPDTGLLTWRVKPSRGVKVGTVAGEATMCGYRRLSLGGKVAFSHRVAWFIMMGVVPKEIDHRNGIRDDNRWENLREVTSSVNKENRHRVRSDSSTGVLGAMPNKKGFMARIRVRGVIHYLGTFPTAEEAHSIYLMAKRRLHEGCTI